MRYFAFFIHVQIFDLIHFCLWFQTIKLNAESQTFLRNVPGGKEQGETAVFAGYILAYAASQLEHRIRFFLTLCAFEQSLFFLGPSSKTRDTQMTTRLTEGARPWGHHARARVLPSLNLKKKRDCSQSNFSNIFEIKINIVNVFPALGTTIPYFGKLCIRYLKSLCFFFWIGLVYQNSQAKAKTTYD